MTEDVKHESSHVSAARLVKVYKTPRKQDMYLYVDFKEDLTRVPETLLEQFGALELALSLKLSASRQLAAANAVDVLQGIETSGYYLQMPPTDGGVDAQIRRSRR